jgi:hypothetical protein
MGLTIHYELRLPATTQCDEVTRLLEELRAYTATVPFEYVSPAVSSTGCGGHTRADACIAFFAELIATPFEEEEPRTADPSTARGFVIDPGDGCETATVGFVSRQDDLGIREWFWRCSCKTQYASIVSDEHMVACHAGLVAVLDHAKALGIDVTVDDETFYWEHRDTNRLLDEVRRMNQLMARFAGALADRMHVQASIFEHPRFERLEMGEE